jgi:hypothetical protein
MPETQELEEAQRLISLNEIEKAAILLWKLYSSKVPATRLNAILGLITTLNSVTENDKLLEITNVGIEIETTTKKDDVAVFLLGKRSIFLSTQLGFLIHRQKSLVLSANIFKWINFSTEKEKSEFEAIAQKRLGIEKEIQNIETTISDFWKTNTDHYFRGYIFMTLGDLYSLKFFNDQLDFMVGGKIRSKIGNIYFIKRWGLDKWLFKRRDRKKIKNDNDKCIYFLKLAISEFESGKYGKEIAHACYNLAVKFKLVFRFGKAKKYLKQAQQLAETNNEKRLLSQITIFRKELSDRNKHIRNYVEEFGLDLP